MKTLIERLRNPVGEQLTLEMIDDMNEAADLLEKQQASLKLFLVRGEVKITHYMVDGEKRQDDSRAVWAVSQEEAEQKWKKYWEDQTDEYSIYYTANVEETAETLS